MAKAKSEYTSKKDNDYSALRAVYPDSENLGSEYPEIQDIREDLSALKNDVVALTSHMKSNSGKHVEELKHFAEKQVSKARKAGVDVLHKVEKRVTEKPGQTIALAFFAGLATSFLLGKRH